MHQPHSTLDSFLAFHCAPTLANIKAANLMNLSKQEIPHLHAEIARFNRSPLAKNVRIRILCECRKKALLLVYRPAKLQSELHQPAHRALLSQFGYPSGASLEELLTELAKRIQQGTEFPHEIGLFLGYPIEDVVGFIRCKGENFKFSGYWKVYGDEQKAKRLFASFTDCRNRFCEQISRGKTIFQILESA